MTQSITQNSVISNMLTMLTTWDTVTSIDFNTQQANIRIHMAPDANYRFVKEIGGRPQTSQLTEAGLMEQLNTLLPTTNFITLTYQGLPIARFSKDTQNSTWRCVLEKNKQGDPITLAEAKTLLNSAKGHC
ncbi:hypothetical protein JOC36_001092 [Weissella uvarum]|uniref:hypothetical protein n=1 Tax=Weissella uvarum TaxID=1479233 RepID=UPI0019610D4C|nr:hypothetical protein [Weissella uvarum]MBM7617535.1 hypothetical protein [Weissella uvarum]MCM0595581.1 hypothetical protein [Weissella uvarum]